MSGCLRFLCHRRYLCAPSGQRVDQGAEKEGERQQGSEREARRKAERTSTQDSGEEAARRSGQQHGAAAGRAGKQGGGGASARREQRRGRNGERRGGVKPRSGRDVPYVMSCNARSLSGPKAGPPGGSQFLHPVDAHPRSSRPPRTDPPPEPQCPPSGRPLDRPIHMCCYVMLLCTVYPFLGDGPRSEGRSRQARPQPGGREWTSSRRPLSVTRSWAARGRRCNDCLFFLL
jgi:hypothetical protein